MYLVKGDLWNYETNTTSIVVPTNIGWKGNGENVMGRGVAKQAAERYSGLSQWYGNWCLQNGEYTPVVKHPNHPIIFFPTKPLNKEKPYYSWSNKSDLVLIEQSTQQLSSLIRYHNIDHTYLPLVGTGNGGLDIEDVLPILQDNLNDDFTLVVTEKDYQLAQELFDL